MLEYMPDAHCPKCNHDVKSVQSWKKDQKTYKYKTGYVYCCPVCSTVVDPYYYAAFNCIDWTDPGTRIGDREKSLSEKTVSRIQYGLDKYGDKPMMIHTSYSKEARGTARPLEQPAFTQTTQPSQAIVVNDQHTSGIACRVRGVSEKLDTIASSHSMKLITPFIIKLEHNNGPRKVTEELGAQTTRQSAMLVQPKNFRPATDPLPTQTTTQGMGFVTVHHGTSKTKKVTDALNGVNAGGIHSGIVTDNAWNSFIAAYYGGSNCTKHITEEMGTVTTGDRMTLVNYQKPNIEDCYYRMLKPKEIQAAMAFNQDYVVLGNSRDKVKQLGNAVTPPAMKWLVSQVVDSLR